LDYLLGDINTRGFVLVRPPNALVAQWPEHQIARKVSRILKVGSSNLPIGTIESYNSKYNKMKSEIKSTVETCVENILKSIGNQLKGEETATLEEIKTRNINIALLKIDGILKPLLSKKENAKFR
jgi:hypothetical protein